jgi:hypothetical protein
MRMSHYYISLMVLAVGGLILTASAGILGWSMHLTVALATAFVVVGMHSMVILFMLISSRLLREGHENCGLSPTFLKRSNDFFRERGGFFLALGGAFSIVTAGVLGYAERAFELPPEVHLLVGLSALVVTLVAIPIELRALHNVEGLLDEAREILDHEDVARAARGEEPAGADHVPYKDSPKAIAAFIFTAPLLVYGYRALIVWRGDFGKVSVHPWVEIAALGLVMYAFARRAEKREVEKG